MFLTNGNDAAIRDLGHVRLDRMKPRKVQPVWAMLCDRRQRTSLVSCWLQLAFSCSLYSDCCEVESWITGTRTEIDTSVQFCDRPTHFVPHGLGTQFPKFFVMNSLTQFGPRDTEATHPPPPIEGGSNHGKIFSKYRNNASERQAETFLIAHSDFVFYFPAGARTTICGPSHKNNNSIPCVLCNLDVHCRFHSTSVSLS